MGAMSYERENDDHLDDATDGFDKKPNASAWEIFLRHIKYICLRTFASTHEHLDVSPPYIIVAVAVGRNKFIQCERRYVDISIHALL